METRDIVNKFIKSWEDNQYVDFTEIFDKGASIDHPYFEHPISASQSMEVMNTAVSGSSALVNYQLVEGDGKGVRDKARLEIYDTGERVEDVSYVGVLPVFVTVVNGKITGISVEKGFVRKIAEKKKNKKLFLKKHPIEKCFGQQSSLAIAIRLARFWGQNFEEEFLKLFQEDAKVRHILYQEELKPEVVVDVMNSNVLGTTELYGFEICRGDGSGKNDEAILKFIETGDQIGYVPDIQGVMKIKLSVINHKIDYLDVLGYEIVTTGQSCDNAREGEKNE